MNIFLTYLVLFFAFSAAAQTLPDDLAPPNGIKLKDNLYIDKTEIANIHWLEFMYYLKKDSSTSFYNKMMPDTTVWNSIPGLDGSWGGFYFNNVQNRYLPVVGLTILQVEKYNEWRSLAVNTFFNNKYEGQLRRNGIDSVIFKFRLPTSDEWQLAAVGPLIKTYGMMEEQLPYEKPELLLSEMEGESVKEILGDSVNLRLLKKHLRDYQKEKRLAFKLLPEELPYFMTIRDLVPAKVEAGPENYLGLYHMIGNVAEMTASSNLVKGGSWLNEFNQINQNFDLYWNGMPNIWVGFRSVCDVQIISLGKE